MKDPTILAVDTSTQTITVAICKGEKVLVDRSEPAHQHHSKRLLKMIDECLKEVDLELKNMDAFATTTGPGSFTGVRTSIGTLKALSFSFQKPLIGIPTLLAMVHPYDHSGTIIPTLDARKDFIYIGKFQKKDDFWTELERPSMIPTSELKNHTLSGSQVVAKDSNFTHIHGKTLCEIAVHKFKNNEFVDTLTVEPLYIQKTAAEGYV